MRNGIFLIIFLLAATQLSFADDSITIYYVNRIPYHYLDNSGKLQGLVATPVLEAFEKAQIPYKVEQLPAKRIIHYLKEGEPNMCGIGWYKNPEREKFAKYSKPVYQNKSRIGITRHDNDLLRSGLSLSDVFTTPQITLIAKSGYSYGKYIDEKIATLKPKTYFTTKENNTMLDMVYIREHTYFLLSEEEADSLIPLSGYKTSDFKYIHFTDVPTGLLRYIIYSKKVDDSLINRVNQALP